MVGIPETSEVQGFIESVNEVSMLIDGLKAGTITPEYIDRKHADKLQRDQKQLVPVPVGSKHASLSSKAGSQPSKAEQAEQDDEAQAKKQQEEETRREQLMEKAKELQANRERKLTARHKYDQYVQVCGCCCCLSCMVMGTCGPRFSPPNCLSICAATLLCDLWQASI